MHKYGLENVSSAVKLLAENLQATQTILNQEEEERMSIIREMQEHSLKNEDRKYSHGRDFTTQKGVAGVNPT